MLISILVCQIVMILNISLAGSQTEKYQVSLEAAHED
jgi:hypothetical protein